MRNTTRLTIATVGLLAVVAGGGAVAFAGTPTLSPAPSSPTPTTPATSATPAPGEAEAKIQRDAAVKIAQDKVPGGTLIDVEFDGDGTPTRWEIELYEGDTEYDFEIDATTGAILEQKQERLDADDKNDRDDRDDRDDDRNDRDDD